MNLPNTMYWNYHRFVIKFAFQCVEFLVQWGAEVNIGMGEDTPLCHACRKEDKHMVGILLEQVRGLSASQEKEKAYKVAIKMLDSTLIIFLTVLFYLPFCNLGCHQHTDCP